MSRDKTKNIAFSAVFVAISVVLCILASVFPTMSLTITAAAGVVSAVALIQCGYRYALLVYIAASLLTLLLSPNKECAVYYIVLFGHYPLLKTFTERISNKAVSWCVKIIEANVLYSIVFFIISYIIGIYEAIGLKELLITAAAYNTAFVLYDICLGKFMMFCISKNSQNTRFR